MNANDRNAVINEYAIAPPVANAPLFATTGTTNPTAMNQSSMGTGHQQQAYNMYAEYVFVCSSYWLANTFARQRSGVAWKYQFSVGTALHGSDLNAYEVDGALPFGNGTMSPAFRIAMQNIWGRFAIYNDPTLPDAIVANLTHGTQDNISAAKSSSWPTWGAGGSYKLLDLNMTQPVKTSSASFSVADARAWEGGRGARCDFWQGLGPEVPE